MYAFFSFHIRSPAQRDVAGSIFSSCFFPFFSSKKRVQTLNFAIMPHVFEMLTKDLWYKLCKMLCMIDAM